MTPQGVRAVLAMAAMFAIGFPGSYGLAQSCERPCVGPPRGAILAAGGGTLDARIYQSFVELAGGPAARIVVIPTAGAEYGSHDGWTAIEQLRDAGAEKMEVLHTRSADVANLEAFASPLEHATGVWFSGGRQWRLVDVYLDTETHKELDALLARGGIIGGNSAGASALASFLLRGGELNGEIIATERAAGFGFLRNVAVDQHVLARGRENEMFEVLRREPQLLGIGLDEGSAIVVTGDLARVIAGRVAVYDNTDPLTLIPLRWLNRGDAYDLSARRMVRTDESGRR
ncbi:MAG: cyanophycinase [Gemmatimonadetes bacterium]|nr:cyanophycinase [Gemmatimonadota bacterium]MDA1103705.1 cyanophycinase [Gemmatimonadota bacterium]